MLSPSSVHAPSSSHPSPPPRPRSSCINEQPGRARCSANHTSSAPDSQPPSIAQPANSSSSASPCPSQPSNRGCSDEVEETPNRTEPILRRDEEPEAEQRGQLGRGGGEHAQQRRRRRGMQAGEEGRGEEPAAAHEEPLPQALLPHPARRQARVPPLGGGGVGVQSQQGHGDAAGPAGQRGGVHQAAQGADRGAKAEEGGRRRRRGGQHGCGRCGRRRRRRSADAGDRGAVPGRDAGRGAHQRGRAAVQAARGDHGAGAGGRRGGQRQLLRRRRQDLLHRPLAGAQPPDRPRRRQGLREAARPAAPRLTDHLIMRLRSSETVLR